MMPEPGSSAPERITAASMKAQRRTAMIWSYVFLVIFAIFFLTPPIYMLITSLKTNAEISTGSLPWWIVDPTLANGPDWRLLLRAIYSRRQLAWRMSDQLGASRLRPPASCF